MRAADTNVLVRLLTRDDPKQVEAVEAFLDGGVIWISHLVLVEAIWVLDSVYGVGRPGLARAVEQLLDHANVTLQEADVVTDALSAFRASTRVGFSDCMVLAVARKAGHLPLATFDRALARLDGTTRV